MWGWHGGADGWSWLWMLPMMMLFWAPVVALVAWLVRGGTAGGGRRAGDLDAIDAEEIARRAYARGEISRERFSEISEDLRESRGERGAGDGT